MATSPLAAVEQAIAEGATSKAEIARRSSVSPYSVDAIIDHLIRLGRLSREVLPSSCSGGACSSCALGDVCPQPTTVLEKGVGRGPVILKLQRQPGV